MNINKVIIKAVAGALLLVMNACSGDELLLSAGVSVADRDPIVEDDGVILEIPISTEHFVIVDANVSVGKNKALSNADVYPIEEVVFQEPTDVVEYKLRLSNLDFGTKYYYKVTVRGFAGTDNFTSDAICKISFKTHEFTTAASDYTIFTDGFVDLGLSVKWYARNLGAYLFPTEFGMTAGWGDPTGVQNSSDESDYGGLYPPQNISGTFLDICTQYLGSEFRTPTYAETDELLEKCTWRFTQWRGQYGWIVVGPSGNAIFLPGTEKDDDYIPYWTATFSSANNKGVFLALYNGKGKNPKCYAALRRSKAYFRPVAK